MAKAFWILIFFLVCIIIALVITDKLIEEILIIVWGIFWSVVALKLLDRPD